MAIAQVIGGFVIVLLPDKSEALISFNSAHGPSVLDIVGLILLVSGWVWLTVYIIARWKKIARSLGKPKLYLLLSIYFIGILSIIFGLRFENEILLWTGVILSGISSLFLILKATRVGKQEPKG